VSLGAGAGPAGALPAGAGWAGGLTLARQIALNAVEVTFDGAPLARDRGGAFDALNPARWRLEVRDPAGAGVRLAQTVLAYDDATGELVSPGAGAGAGGAGESWHFPILGTPAPVDLGGLTGVRFVVIFDGPLDAIVVYRIVVEGITDVYGIEPYSAFADFVAFKRVRVAPELDLERPALDLANPQTERDRAGAPALGSLSVDETGDWANDAGTPSLRKRILRRISSAAGTWFHMPDYGLAQPLKRLVSPGRLLRLQARAQAQILREPDVASARVSVSAVAPGVVRVTVRAKSTAGAVEVVNTDLDLGGAGG
jgi:hypothetical protein